MPHYFEWEFAAQLCSCYLQWHNRNLHINVGQADLCIIKHFIGQVTDQSSNSTQTFTSVYLKRFGKFDQNFPNVFFMKSLNVLGCLFGLTNLFFQISTWGMAVFSIIWLNNSFFLNKFTFNKYTPNLFSNASHSSAFVLLDKFVFCCFSYYFIG